MDFIDSFQFMSPSLETLVGHVAKEGSSQFNHMRDHFGDQKLPLLLRKQVYPYDYFDSEAKFSETSVIIAVHHALHLNCINPAIRCINIY
jgi:hypothetical protein